MVSKDRGALCDLVHNTVISKDRGVYGFVRTHKGYFGGNWEFLLPVPPTSLHFLHTQTPL